MTDMRTEIADLLRAAGITVAHGNRAKGVIVEAHGEGVCALRFRPERPSSLPHGLPWDADKAACELAHDTIAALVGRPYTRTLEGATGRALTLLVSRREGVAA